MVVAARYISPPHCEEDWRDMHYLEGETMQKNTTATTHQSHLLEENFQQE